MLEMLKNYSLYIVRPSKSDGSLLSAKTTLVLIGVMLVVQLLCVSSASAEKKHDPDYAFTSVYHYKIKKGKARSVLSSKVQESRILLAKRANHTSQFYIYEGADTKVDHLSARLNGKKLKKGRINYHFNRPQDIFFAHSKYYIVDFPSNMNIGDSLSYKYRRKFTDVAYMPIIRVPNIDYIKLFEVIFEHPSEYRVDFEFFFPRNEIEYSISREETMTTLIFNSIPGQPELPYYKYNNILAAALVTVSVNDTPITPITVDGFVDWYSKLATLTPELAESNRDVLSEEINEAVAIEDKLEVIHDYVRHNIRYIGIEDPAHTIVPHKPASVLSNKYGDCKDRACLVSAIANEHGIPVQMALVAGSNYIPFDGEHVRHYNHMICYYQDDGQSMYFDPTARSWAFATIPESIVGNHTLVLDSAGAFAGSLFATNNPISLEMALTAHMDSLEMSSGTAILRNGYLSFALYSIREMTASEADRKILNSISSSMRGVKLENITYSDSTSTSMQVFFDVDLSGFVVKTQRRTYIPVTPFVIVDNDVFSRREDSLPLMFKDLDGVQLQVNLQTSGMKLDADSLFLGGVFVDSADESVNSEVDYSYSSSCRMNDSSQIHVSYTFKRKQKYFEGIAKTRYLQFCKDYLDEKKRMYTIEWIEQ